MLHFSLNTVMDIKGPTVNTQLDCLRPPRPDHLAWQHSLPKDVLGTSLPVPKTPAVKGALAFQEVEDRPSGAPYWAKGASWAHAGGMLEKPVPGQGPPPWKGPSLWELSRPQVQHGSRGPHSVALPSQRRGCEGGAYLEGSPGAQDGGCSEDTWRERPCALERGGRGCS